MRQDEVERAGTGRGARLPFQAVVDRLVLTTSAGLTIVTGLVVAVTHPTHGAFVVIGLLTFVLLFNKAVHGGTRHRKAAVFGMLAGLAAAVWALLPAGPAVPEPAPPPTPTPVVTVTPSVTATASEERSDQTITLGVQARGLRADGGRVWSLTDSGIVNFDPTSPREAPLVVPGTGGAFDFDVQGEHLVIVRGGVMTLRDALSGRRLARYTFGESPGPVVVRFGAAWIGNVSRSKLGRFDVAFREYVELALPGRPTAIETARGAVWVTTDNGWLTRVDPATLAATRHRIAPGATRLRYGFGLLWIAHPKSRIVTRLDPGTGRRVGTAIRVRPSTEDLASLNDSMFAISSTADVLQRLDGKTGKMSSSMKLPEAPSGVVTSHGRLFVSSAAHGNAFEVIVRRR